jgi:hypothetical protein
VDFVCVKHDSIATTCPLLNKSTGHICSLVKNHSHLTLSPPRNVTQMKRSASRHTMWKDHWEIQQSNRWVIMCLWVHAKMFEITYKYHILQINFTSCWKMVCSYISFQTWIEAIIACVMNDNLLQIWSVFINS